MLDWTYESSDQAADMDAMNVYMQQANARTNKAKQLKQEWANWFDSIGFWEFSHDENIRKQAVNRKNAFDQANVTSSAEQKALDDFHRNNAVTYEEIHGKPRMSDSSGNYLLSEQDQGDDSLLTTKGKIIFGAILIVGGAAWLAKKVYVDPYLRLARGR